MNTAPGLRRTILVVEDNPITRKMVRLALSTEGYHVLEAPDGRTALAQVASGAPDLVLQDLLLPDMDGLELLARLRQTEGGRSLPILAFTGLIPKLDESRTLSAGFDDFLVKPVEPSRLAEAVRRHLPAAGAAHAAKPGLARRVIVADDEPVQRKLAVLRLEEMGFVTEPAVDGEEALERARASPPDAILADVLMPRLDGFKLCLAVRSDPRLSRVPVVLVSSQYVEEGDRQLGRNVGASAFVVRTPGMREAIAALLESLERKPPPPEPRRREEVEAEYLQRLVRQLERQAALNATMLDEQAVRATSLTVLSATAEALSRQSDLGAALRDALYYCLDAVGLSIGAVYMKAADGALHLQAQIGLIAGGRTRDLSSVADVDGLLGVIESRQPVVVPSDAMPSEAAGELLRRLEATSALAVPFSSGSEAAGILLVASQSRNLGQGDWLPFARALAAQFGQAVALAQAFDRVGASERRYRTLMEHANDGISVISPEGTILELNYRMEQILGISRASVIGRHISEFPRADAAAAKTQEFAEVVARGGGGVDDVPLARPDGTVTLVDFSLSTMEIEGKPCVLAIGRDVTERRRAEEALAERARLASFAADVNMALSRSEALNDMLLGCAKAMVHYLDAAFARIWTLDPAGKVLELKASAGMYTHLDGAHARVPVGKFKIGLIAEERLPHLTNDVLNDPRVSDPEWARREGMVSFAGYPLIIGEELVGVAALFARQALSEFTLKALAAASDSIALGIKRKVAEADLKLKDEQFRQAQKMEAVGQLAGGVAHDFNNLLGVITGYGELLQRDVGPGHPAFRRVEAILTAAERAAGLTRQLLAFSRKQVMQPKVLDLNAVVADIEKMLRRLIGEDIQLVSISGASLGGVNVDPGQIEQVLMNLAVNARDAMPQGGKLIFETANVVLDAAYTRTHTEVKPGSYVMLAVSDTGHGMDTATQARAFEPFFTTKEPGKGTGLGLSTVFGIVKQSGGHITVYSEEGKGTTFKVYLPRVEAAVEEPTAAAPEPVPSGNETILLLEDEIALRMIIRELLEAGGYRVIDAATPEDSLEAGLSHPGPLHLLLSDVVMPRMGGAAVAARLRQSRPAINVLFMSGYTDEAIGHHGVLDPGTHFLQKPFTADNLLRKVRQVLDEGAR